MAEIIIRENIPQYLSELKAWLEDVKDAPLEEMRDFFQPRLQFGHVLRDVFAYDNLGHVNHSC